MKPLVNFYDGEPWFDNPQLIVANPKKRRSKTMRRTRRRRGRKNAPRRMRRNYYGAGVLANRPRRRRARRSRARRRFLSNVYMPMNRKRGRRRYRSNPNRGGGRRLFGFQLPPMGDVLFTGAGLIGPNLVSAQILKILPTSLTLKADGTPNTLVIWATKIISVLLPSWLLRRFVNPRAGTAFLIGGSAGLALDALKTYAPGIIPGIGYQPLLGAYFQRPAAQIPFQRPGPRGLPTQVAEAPERLSPQARF